MPIQDRLKLAMAYKIAALELNNASLPGTIASLNHFAEQAEQRGDFIAASVFTHTIELISDRPEPENERLELL